MIIDDEYDDLTEDELPRREVPQSNIDLNLMTTNPEWGRPSVNKTLQKKLSEIKIEFDEKGNPTINKERLWGLLNYYTRDLRLSNLDKTQLYYVQYYLDLGGDFLQSDMVKAFIICLTRAA